MKSKKKFHTVTFLPENITIRVEHLLTIFEAFNTPEPEEVQLHFACGSEGICQKCKIRSFQQMGPLTPTELGCLSAGEISRGVRLACQARVIQDMQCEIIYKQPFTIELLDEPLPTVVEGSRHIRKVCVPAGSAAAACAAVFPAGSPASATKEFDAYARQLQSSPCSTTVLYDDDLVTVEAGDTTGQMYAAAVDLGVNTLQATLVDLVAGRTIARVTDTNPQIELGTDITQRIAMVEEDDLNFEILSEEILLRIDILVLELCRARDLSPLQVYEIAVSGPTGMLHLYLSEVFGALDQQVRLGSGRSGRFTAEQLYFRSPVHATVTALPAASVYAGADIVAAMLATHLHRSDDAVLLLELGTVCRVVAHVDGQLLASTIDGCTVLDGADITCGMQPTAGAVTRVTLAAALECAVVGESLPRGICGSGLLSLAAALRAADLLSDDGQLAMQERPWLVAHDDQPAVLLYHDAGEFDTDLHVTRDDLQRVLSARDRIRELVRHVCAHAGIATVDFDRVLVGGPVGDGLSPADLVSLGLIPPACVERVRMVGNTVCQGTQMALLDRAVLDEAEQLALQVQSIPPPAH